MRTMEELDMDSRVLTQGVAAGGLSGYLMLQSGQHRMFPFTLDLVYVRHVVFERVRFQPGMCNADAEPSLEELSEIKDIFWTNDEEVHFIFPSKEDLMDSTDLRQNSSEINWSLWRPREGWKY